MPRCPEVLNVDDFDKLAGSMELKLTDDGVSALGEITELIAKLILSAGRNGSRNATLNLDSIVTSAEKIGIKVDVDRSKKKVNSVRL